MESTQDLILSAATGRFERYGYGKTTMAEIAGDCEMSAANLYRYFKSKLDIGAALACQCMDRDEERLRAVVARTHVSVEQRLEEFILETLHFTHDMWSKQLHTNEMVQNVCDKRPEIVQEHIKTKIALLVELIEQGDETGELDVADFKATAAAIHLATTVFDVPHFMHLASLEEFEQKARDVAVLLTRGIKRHP